MRWFYSLMLYLAMPLVFLHLLLRSIRNPDYRRRWAERFGVFEPPSKAGGILVHAVSVGEVNAASSLIKALADKYPDVPMCVTTFTPTGSDRVRDLFGDDVFHVYAPFDTPGAVRRFFGRIQPRLLIVMETEIWPNLYYGAAEQKIPVMIANARISEKSFTGYRRIRPVTRFALAHTSCIAAQSEADAERLSALGAVPERLVITGNLKFDVKLPDSLVEQGRSVRDLWGHDRPVLMAGSTHEKDEDAIFPAFLSLKTRFPNALLVLVPRHPERFSRVAQQATQLGLQVSLRSEGMQCPETTSCFIVDTMGELQRLYAACDVAFVGGSIDPVGGHNVLEPAAMSKPVLVGPHTFNFEDITEQLVTDGAALRVADADQLASAAAELFNNPDKSRQMGEAGLELVRSGRGALAHTLEIVDQLWHQSTPT